MKILKWVTFEQEVEIEVSGEDVIVALASAADADARERDLLRALNTSLSWLLKLPQSAIDELPEAPRKIFAEHLRKQADRFVAPKVR